MGIKTVGNEASPPAREPPTVAGHPPHSSSLKPEKPPSFETPMKLGVAPRRPSQVYSVRTPRKLTKMPRGGRLKEVGLEPPKPPTPPATESSSSDAASSSSDRSANQSVGAHDTNGPTGQRPTASPNFPIVQSLSLPEETSPQKMGRYVSQVPVEPRYNAEEELKTAGKWRVGRERIYLIAAVVCVK